jgi:hypothetical protein
MPRVIHFEIPANDPEQCVRFYGGLLGWKFHKWDGPMEYWLVDTGPADQPGINGGLMRRRHPDQPVVNTVDVASVDETCAKVASLGGLVVVPKMPVPGIGWLAYCKDPDGNIFGIMQTDPSAA